jgi:hypothetical protein
MRRSSVLFLQAVIVALGLAVLAFLLWEPHVEGRNAHATPFEIYFNDPFLAYVYLASIPFFVALYQACKALSYAGRNEVFTPPAVRALRTIKHCAMALVVLAMISFVFMLFGDAEDGPPGLFLRLIVIFPSIVVATAAAMIERILQSAVDLKAEHDLTV